MNIDPTSADIDGVQDASWMEGLEGGTFVSFSDDSTTLEFITDTPTKRKNKWDKDVWEWDVRRLDSDLHEVSNLTLSTASRRLRRALATHHPLTAKILRISRSGKGMDTEYNVIEISRKGSTKLV